MSKPPFQRRKFLVDPELQIGLSTEMVGWIFVYFLVFSLIANLPSLVAVATSPPDEAAYLAAMDHLRGFARYVILPMGVTFVAMSIHGVYVTHRIAGPIVRLKRTMRELAARRMPGTVALREKDHFKDLADEMNAAIAVLREDGARRRKMTDETIEKMRALVAVLENRPQDLREPLSLAHDALDGLEALSSHLNCAGDADAAASRPVPLPEADLPDVVRESLDEIEPAARPHG